MSRSPSPRSPLRRPSLRNSPFLPPPSATLSVELPSPTCDHRKKSSCSSRSPHKTSSLAYHKPPSCKNYEMCSSKAVFVFSRKKKYQEKVTVRISGGQEVSLFQESTLNVAHDEVFLRSNGRWPKFRIHPKSSSGFRDYRREEPQGKREVSTQDSARRQPFTVIDAWESPRENTEMELF